jgi:HEAT repeat protein
MLEAYREGLEHAETPASWLPSNWGRTAPATRLLWAALMLLIGLFAGRLLFFDNRGAGELTELRADLREMRQMVTLSMLQQQSASERLTGLIWSQRLREPDAKVLDALVRTVNSDSDVNVRLAAVDALFRFSDDTAVKHRLLESLTSQSSPLVQIALIDLLVELRERRSVEVLRRLVADESVDENVRKRASWALQHVS